MPGDGGSVVPYAATITTAYGVSFDANGAFAEYTTLTLAGGQTVPTELSAPTYSRTLYLNAEGATGRPYSDSLGNTGFNTYTDA